MGFFQKIFAGKDDKFADRVVGIDIGSSSIKVVELENKKDILTLTTYGEIQLGPYVDDDVGKAVTLSPKKEQEAFVDILRESAVKTKDAVFSMPLSSSFVTNIHVKADAEADLDPLVKSESRKVIPVPLSDVVLDWAELSSDDTKNKNKKGSVNYNILIAAIQNVYLNRFKILMKFAELNNPPIEIECFSLIRAIYKGKEDNFAIIDIGASSTKLYIVKAGVLMRMYRVRVGGMAVSKQISKIMEIDFAEAEQKKKELHTDNLPIDFRRANESVYGRVLREFSQVLNSYERKSGDKLTTVYLSGGGSLFPGTVGYVKDILNKNTVMVDAFSSISYPAFMEDVMKEISPSFAVSLGAALRWFE